MTTPNDRAALDKCFSTARLNGLTLRNRIIKAGTFEGKTPGGLPTAEYTELHRRIGEGGTAMTTLAYCAAENDGRLNENMIYMDDYVREPLTALIQTIKTTGACVSGQLSHAGGFSKNKQLSTWMPRGPSFGLNRLGMAQGMFFSLALSKAQIRERVATMGRAAAFMKSVGFDAIEIHFGHGYGLSQFISPITNKRGDEYGGSLVNRMRFPLEVLAAVRQAVGDGFPLLGKISMSDGVRGGVSYEESPLIAEMFDQAGLDCVIPSDGTSSMNPMLLFHGDSILPGMLRQEKNLLMQIGLRAVGPRLFRYYPYRETYLIENARRIRDKVKRGSVCYIGGVSSNESIAKVMGEGFDFIQLGRTLLFDPDFVKHAQADAAYVNGCNHCNLCATLIEAPGGIRCVVREGGER
ncbi:NADH:flavin oxidoreductase/NADH oxidase [Sterolibacterium denitrificans]|uniref:NADH:flavin oxidoreductase/NADH oxidase n=2 Tax=Sterolibacterium denitrificans TaxID=157592 RepID=A0A7Z7HS77_9PROT|nr:NADH:flavin oxidoreductase [Sterolibacterium denitrificans]KYC29144.1 oxidoreductase [Sterolibacterium denitrificans]SMB29238.1 NADH:flavin oxidoreductase/NADH oxidase [Sterolibacterium denitrificans]